MIEKLPNFDSTEASIYHVEKLYAKVNQLVDAINGILDYAPLEMAMKAEPKTPAETVQQVSYIAPGDITVFHGFNCSVEFDIPLPKGTRITIKSITKGGDNE
jgi:hypothetical protein